MPVVKINAIEVPAEAGPELEKRFAHRAHAVENSPGFLGFQLLRPVKGEDRYFVVTHWESEEAFQAWAHAHPDGYVVSFYRRFRFRADPVYAQKFRGGEVSMWNAADALASGVDPASSHAGDEPDESDD